MSVHFRFKCHWNRTVIKVCSPVTPRSNQVIKEDIVRVLLDSVTSLNKSPEPENSPLFITKEIVVWLMG
ncbi:hypothetical protein CEXT_644951 [Caerostris extrusa]|uniref:Uncharacterized protein n=1 Tax=Caerostris extrusa TaxID=172846 RepID=A0AAV4RG84_CAEEX|nr:hypothetical protein CEXT_644951 [Caerostris extrusa]